MVYMLMFQAVVDCGALEALVICLEEFDPGVKESAAWALGYVARHNAGKAQLYSSTNTNLKLKLYFVEKFLSLFSFFTVLIQFMYFPCRTLTSCGRCRCSSIVGFVYTRT